MLVDTTIRVTTNAPELLALLTLTIGAMRAGRRLFGAPRSRLRRPMPPRITLVQPVVTRCKQLLLGRRRD